LHDGLGVGAGTGAAAALLGVSTGGVGAGAVDTLAQPAAKIDAMETNEKSLKYFMRFPGLTAMDDAHTYSRTEKQIINCLALHFVLLQQKFSDCKTFSCCRLAIVTIRR
jgi:hypothetical protein